MSKDLHHCILGIDTFKNSFPPLHPKRYFSDLLRRRIKQYTILDQNDLKCKSFFSNGRSMRFEFKRHLSSPYRYVIHPFSKANSFLQLYFFVLVLFRFFILGVKFSKEFVIMEIVTNAFWLLLMMSIFFTGYINYTTKEICIHPRRISLRYLRTYFIFDLILLVKTPLRLCTSTSIFHFILLVLSIVSLFVRIRTVMFVLKHILTYFGTNKLLAFFIYEFLKLACILHLITCGFVVIPDHVHTGKSFWLFTEHHTRFSAYSQSFLIVICYFFGADYDLDTSDPLQNVVLFSVSFIGRLYTLQLIARMLMMYGMTDISASKYEQQMAVLRTYVHSLKIPEKLKHRIIGSYEKQSRKQYFDEEEISSILTEHLKTELFLYGVKSLITKNSVLKTIPKADLVGFLTLMKSRIYFCNDVIILAGDEIKHTYFISSGCVAGYNMDGEEFMHLEGGDEFGITYLIYKQHKTSVITWIASETTEVYCVTRDELSRFLRSQPEVASYFEAKVKEKFEKFYGRLGEWKTPRDNVILSLRRGEILEKQRERLFSMD